ncbi:MAG: histidinol dehydrogenase [bacterium]
MIRYLKTGKNTDNPFESDKALEQSVSELIQQVATGGDAAVRALSEKFDGYSPESFRLSDSEIQRCIDETPDAVLRNIEFSLTQVENFAKAQRDGLRDVEVENMPGVILGHKNIPVNSVGCYVPAGKYPCVSSVYMCVTPAKVAGVKRIAAFAPPVNGKPCASIVAAMHMTGADEIYTLGGVQAIAAMAYGTDAIAAVDMIVGPGNAYVAEAKRQLYGRIGIDMFAGPTETLVIADGCADPQLCAADLLGQAEHGPTSVTTLLTNSEELATRTLEEITQQLKVLPTADVAGQSWADFGQIIVCDSLEEMVEQADRIACEHVQVMTENPDYFLENLTNYGALFLGEETNVAYGDECSGTNHTLPTNRAARYTGGLWVGSFIKTVTYQRVTPEASVKLGRVASENFGFEGFHGHKKQADLRIARYTSTDQEQDES